MTNLSSKQRIIFPLDLPTGKEALKYVNLLKDHVGVFKIGLELFVSEGPSVVHAVKKAAPGLKIFLDMKFHDIPETVRRAAGAAAKLGVDFITVHCEEGMGLLRAAADEAGGMKVLGITVLTSLSKEDLKGTDPEELVLRRAEMAKLAGLSGVVCSGREVKRVKEAFGRDFIAVVPGIRFSADTVREKDIKAVKKDDQKRVVAPYEAIKDGADYIVVGRPIKDAKDPLKAAALVASEIERAIKDRELS